MRKFIKITSDKFPSHSAKFMNPDGTEIKGVVGCDIRMRIDEICTATLGLRVDEISINAEPLLSFDTVCEAANYYGYDLIPIQKDKMLTRKKRRLFKCKTF